MTATMVDRMEYFLETRPFLTQERMMATTAKAMESKQEMSSSSGAESVKTDFTLCFTVFLQLYSRAFWLFA